MIIGVDVDGVLVDMYGYQTKYANIYFDEKRGKKVVNPKAFDIEEMYECSHKEREQFWTKYIWKYCLSEPMTEGAADTVRKMREQGHEIYVITGRAHTTEMGVTGKLFRWMLKYWLKKNKFEYDKIFFVSEKGSAEEKLKVCLDEHIDVLVDDKPENLFGLKDKIKVICYPAAWNEGISELDEYRVNRFTDILDMIDNSN